MIEVCNVTKTYNKKNIRVLKGINFTIPDGEIVALLGHNGSGKSTLLKCMTGVIKPTEGEVLIDGKNVFSNRKKIVKKIGVVFNQKPSFIVDLTVMDNLMFFKAIYEISKSDFEDMLNIIDQYLHISSLFGKQYRKLSFGERVKCEIASVMFHKPSYLFLDEPTIGLDYNTKKGMYDLLHFFNKTYGTTIIVITHEVDYIQNICNHALIMSNGELRYINKLSNIKKIEKEQGVILHITYSDVSNLEKANEFISKAFQVNEKDHKLSFKVKDEEMKNEILKKAINVLRVEEIKVEKISLREVLESVLKENNLSH